MVELVKYNMSGFRDTPDELYKNGDLDNRFMMVCGHSPQLKDFIDRITRIAQEGIITTAYKDRFDKLITWGKLNDDSEIVEIGKRIGRDSLFRENGKHVLESPYILTRQFYERVRNDGFSNWMGFYFKEFMENKGKIYGIESDRLSEFDWLFQFRQFLEELRDIKRN